MSRQRFKTAVALFLVTTFSAASYQACSAGPDTSPALTLQQSNALPTWWKQSVFYQVYPRSFKDTNGTALGI